MSLPLVISWVGVMVSIGFTTAYYIPVLPYIIFLFGAIAWLMAVVEAMVAAPIVALGVTHPEGHDAFGKGEAAIMILVNVFLRPSMMIIGYISGIILSYVGIWMLNAGYDIASSSIKPQGATDYASIFSSDNARSNNTAFNTRSNVTNSSLSRSGYSTASVNYSDWAGMYAYFFGILTYTTLYLTIVQKSFTLISNLPDKVLRWIGGSPESAGQESAQWAGDVQKQHEGASKATSDAQGQMQKQMTAGAMKGIKGAKDMAKKGGGKGSAEAS
jgi:defect-in-organelle-trafficking protein DotA